MNYKFSTHPLHHYTRIFFGLLVCFGFNYISYYCFSPMLSPYFPILLSIPLAISQYSPNLAKAIYTPTRLVKSVTI